MHRYERFDWLEYSVEKQAAFCFVCRLFASGISYTVRGGEGKGGHHNPDVVFTETEFRNWKAALDGGKGSHGK